MTTSQPTARVDHPALRLELDVTPRWWAFGPGLFDDAADVSRAIGASGGQLVGILVDLSVGVTGVRMVVLVPAGPSTNAFEDARLALMSLLDGLDASNPRRARVTTARAAAEMKRLADLAIAARIEAEAKEAADLAESARVARANAEEAEAALAAKTTACASNGAPPAVQPLAQN